MVQKQEYLHYSVGKMQRCLRYSVGKTQDIYYDGVRIRSVCDPKSTKYNF